MRICMENIPAKYHPFSIWNDGTSGVYFEDGRPNKKKNNNKKMSSDMRAVSDPKNHILQVTPTSLLTFYSATVYHNYAECSSFDRYVRLFVRNTRWYYNHNDARMGSRNFGSPKALVSKRFSNSNQFKDIFPVEMLRDKYS